MRTYFRGCSAEVAAELNRIVNTTSRGVSKIRSAYAYVDSEIILFLGRRQYGMLCTVNPADAYALLRHKKTLGAPEESFMGCTVLCVMQENYLKLAASETLIGD